VSVGANGKVWAVAADGSAFLRHGVTEVAPAGQLWLHVAAPKDSARLREVEVGKHSVWALDSDNKLYLRQEVTHV